MDVTVGEELPVYRRPSGFHQWNRYAAVNYEFVPIHMDDDAGKAAGYAGAFGMGNLQTAYLHCLLRGWMGEEGRIVSMSGQFRAPNVHRDKDTLAKGRVTAVREEGGERVVDLEVWTETADGETMCPGTATVTLPA